jgi:hypothetical protein
VTGRRTIRRWVIFHRLRAAVWVILLPIALKFWPDAVWFVIVCSLYANFAGDLGAAEAADDRQVLERLDRIEKLLRNDAK